MASNNKREKEGVNASCDKKCSFYHFLCNDGVIHTSRRVRFAERSEGMPYVCAELVSWSGLDEFGGVDGHFVLRKKNKAVSMMSWWMGFEVLTICVP